MRLLRLLPSMVLASAMATSAIVRGVRRAGGHAMRSAASTMISTHASH